MNTMAKSFFVNPFEKKPNKDPMAPSYIKPDGTQVIEQIMDYARDRNVEISHHFDEFGKMIYKNESVYDEHNVLAKKDEYDYDYYDSGAKKTEIITSFPGEVTTYMQFEENGKRIEKIVERGTVKTWYDENDKPLKREIDRGSGGIITEDLTKKEN